MSRSSSNSQNHPNREKIESVHDDDFQSIMNSIINEEYIRRETGADDIEAIIHLNLVIDTAEQSVFELSEILPNLKHLILDHSNIASIRDLGIGLRFLTSLSLSSCSLYDIDGIGVLIGLQELCLSDNYLTDVTPLAMHENIQNLNLSGNKIADISVGDDLSSCAKLKTLFLQRNPISKMHNYRLIIPSLITGLVMLDGTRVDPSAVNKVTHGMMLEAASELRAIDEDIDDEGRLEQELSMQLSTTNNNNNCNLKHISKQGLRQTVLQSMPPSRRIVDGAVPDTGSELTHGSSVVLAGNMAAAVRRRRQLIANASSEQGGGGIWDNRSVDRHESTIELLDAALHRSDGSSLLGDDRAGAFLREGDVTSSLMGSAALFVDSGIAYDEECSSPQLDSGCSRQGVDSHKHLPLAEGFTRTSSLHHPTAAAAVSMDTSFEVEYRPRSANSFLLRVSGSVPNESAAPSTGTLLAQQSSQYQSQSPRQRNSSRPTTAAAAMACETPRRGAAAFAVPFKVDINASTVQPGKSMKQQKQQLEELDGLDSIDLEDESRPSSWAAASLVHLDIVKRKILTGHHSMHGDTADEEDICLTHADRHKLMSSSAVRSDANSATANMKSRQHVLQQLKGTVYQGVPIQQQQPSLIATHHRDPSVASSGGSIQTHAPSSSRNSSNSTASSKAGISLGFHLAGSLAAIDRWVEEVDEDGSDDDDGDDDDDDDDDQSQCAMESCEDTHGSSSHLKSQLLYSFASIPVLDIAQKDDQTPSNSNSSQKPACKILSRDAIMNMCSNSSGSNTSRVAADHDSDSDGELQVLSEEEEEEEASGHGAKTSETSTAVPIASSSSSSSSSTTHSMNQRLFTGNSIGRIRPLTKPREEEVRQVSAAGRAKHLMAPGAVDPVSRTGTDQTHTSSVADRNEKGGTKLVLLSKQQHGAVTGTGRPISDAHAAESNWDDDNSPPRFTHDPNNNDVNRPSKSSGNLGGASLMSDHELVDLLRRPPKSTLILRTKSNFQQFFRGVDRCRMQSLLARAYEDIADASERSLKIKKRLGLLDDSDA